MLSEVKKIVKNNRITGPYYEKLSKYLHDAPLRGEHRLESPIVGGVGKEKLCIVLAGYKEYLYPAVFGRLAKYAPKDMDMCICSSGLYSEKLSDLCKEQGWNYLSTKRNNVSLVQNIAISLFPKAKFIYKLDEDIFITEDYFERMQAAYAHAAKVGYDIGVLAPLIPLNGYGNLRILEKLDLVEKYTEMFETPKYITDYRRKTECDSAVARFFWGEGGYVPTIDEMSMRFARNPMEERPCPIRFSIGAILFKRSLWEDMHYFPVEKGRGLGSDEIRLCDYCCEASRPLMVSENIVVGHFAFSQQNEAMREYFYSNKEIFMNQ